MILLLASSMTLILVNLLFAGIALAVGFVAGAWFLGGRSGADRADAETSAEKALEERLANERALFATARLKDLAAGVATDVGEHSSQVKRINAGLIAVKDAPDEQRGAELTAAFNEIIHANEKLQKRLESAEKQIQSQAEEIKTHESEARTDSLTKIANRRAFDDCLNQRFAEWTRKSTPFSLLILDVDHFKKFNDTHGHQAGDEVLRQVAKSLKETVRDMDIPCRYGGEEFAIVLPATQAKDACGLAERIRESIEGLQTSFQGKSLQVTASLGLAQVNQQDNTVSILKRADDALYASKNGGRNCGHLADNGDFILIAGDAQRSQPQPTDQPAEQIATPLLDSLPNRTKFAEELRRRIAACERTLEPLSVLTVEFESYDQILADYGDQVANVTLNSVAQFLQNTLREMDLLGRLDDARLVVMLPSAKVEEAFSVADRASKALAGCSIPLGEEQLSLATRIGAAQLQADDNAASLISRATDAMLPSEISNAAAV